MTMSTLYTIGFRRKTLAEFINLLRQAAVNAVIDIRLRNTSQLSGYAKRDDLAFLLREGFGIAYEHRLDLAPTEEILDAFGQEKDWDRYQQRFIPLLAERQAEDTGREILSRYPAICLGLTTGNGAHTVGEYINIAPLQVGLEQLVRVIEGLDRG